MLTLDFSADERVFLDVFHPMIDVFCSKHFFMKMRLYLDSENKSFIVGSRKLQLPQLTEGTASTVL